MRGSWNHSASMIGFTFCHVSCLHSTLCVLADHLYYHGCVDRELRVGQKYCMQPLLLLQGEKSAALVGCTTVSGQANPHSIQKKRVSWGKTGNWRPSWQKHAAKSQQPKCLWPRFRAGARQLCSHLLTWCRWGCLDARQRGPWSNGFFWLIRWKPAIRPAANDWTGWKCCSYVADTVHRFQSCWNLPRPVSLPLTS